ncbi:MAG: SdrD B-like domain-containing protein, partial [Acidobacteriota bacterium]
LQAHGGFLVVWSDSSTAARSIRGQRYDSSGSPLSGELELTSEVAFGDIELEADPTTGNFVVAWEIEDDGSGTGIRARRFDSGGQPLGDHLAVNSYTGGSQTKVSLSMDPDGDFVIVWQSFGGEVDDDRFSIQGRRYASDGEPIGGQFLVNSYTTDAQLAPAVAVDGFGDFVVTWTDYREDLGDSSFRGIVAQRFRVTADLGDRVFFDTGSDGVQSMTDPGVEGVGVRLRDGSGELLAETITDADGHYLFKPKIGARGIIDQFVLDFDRPSSGLFTFQDRGSDESIDSDVDPATGETDPLIILSAGAERLDLDAGIRPVLFADGFESGDTSAWSASVNGLRRQSPSPASTPQSSTSR